MASLLLNYRIAKEFLLLDPQLTEIVFYILNVWPVETMVPTCIYRTEEENESAGAKTKIHCVGPPYRSLDLRVRNLGSRFQPVANEISKKVNLVWTYDPDRPKLRVAYSKPHGTGPHIHLQIHPRTERKRDV